MIGSKSMDSDSDLASFKSDGTSEYWLLTDVIAQGVLCLFRSDITNYRKTLIWDGIRRDFAARRVNVLRESSALLAFDQLRRLRAGFRILELRYFSFPSDTMLGLEIRSLKVLLKMMVYVYRLFRVC